MKKLISSIDAMAVYSKDKITNYDLIYLYELNYDKMNDLEFNNIFLYFAKSTCVMDVRCYRNIFREQIHVLAFCPLLLKKINIEDYELKIYKTKNLFFYVNMVKNVGKKTFIIDKKIPLTGFYKGPYFDFVKASLFGYQNDFIDGSLYFKSKEAIISLEKITNNNIRFVTLIHKKGYAVWDFGTGWLL